MTKGICATIFYGMKIDWDDNKEFLEDVWDWESKYQELHGITFSYPRGENYQDTPEYKEYIDKCVALINSCPCTIDDTGDSDWDSSERNYYVAMKISMKTSHDGALKSLSDNFLVELVGGGDWVDQIEDFCKEMGIKYNEKNVGWFLTASSH